MKRLLPITIFVLLAFLLPMTFDPGIAAPGTSAAQALPEQGSRSRNRASLAGSQTALPVSSLAGLLGPDGSLHLPLGFSGSLDVRGYRLVSGQNEPPRFASSATVSGDDNWIAGFTPSGANDEVDAIAVDNNGVLYIGGQFTNVAGIRAAHIAAWDGRDWSPVGGGFDGPVYALAYDTVHDFLYAGGLFTHVCLTADCASISTVVNYIARWSSGSWSSMDYGLSYTVHAMALDNDNNLYVGGEFIGYCTDEGCNSPVRTNSIAVWRSFMPAWFKVGTGTDPSTIGISGKVYALAWDPSGNLYVGGQFSAFGGQNFPNIARYTPQTLAWSPLQSNGYTWIDGTVYALKVDPVNAWVYIGGDFDFLCQEWNCSTSLKINHITRWDTGNSGWAWAKMGDGVDQTVYSLDIDSLGNVYIGGKFTRICDYMTCVSGAQASFLAEWVYNDRDPQFGGWAAFGGGSDGVVHAIKVSNPVIYVSGEFDSVGLASATRVAVWDGRSWASLDSGNGVGNSVYALATDLQGDVYAGGFFRGAGYTLVNNVAKWNGKLWSSLSYGIKGPVVALAVDRQGRLYAGGYFTYTCPDLSCAQNGKLVNHVARWDGTSWQAVGYGFNDNVDALAIDHNGVLYAGGLMSAICKNADCSNASPAFHIARWNSASGTWSPLGIGLDSWVSTIAVDQSNHLYVGGAIDTICANSSCSTGQHVNNIARWNGASWSGVGYGLNNQVKSLAIDNRGIVYAGGVFTHVCSDASGTWGQQVNNIAHWDGVRWSPLDSGLGGMVYSLAVDAVGRIYAGGYISEICLNNICTKYNFVNNIARWDGKKWSSLGSGIGIGYHGIVAMVLNDGKLSVGGNFWFAGDKISFNFAQHQDYFVRLPFVRR